MALYDDFEDGTLDKWTYWENYPPSYTQVNEGDANIPTRHVEYFSGGTWTSYRNTLFSNGEVGSGKYIKAGIFRKDQLVQMAGGLVIRADAGGDSFYLASLESGLTRVWKHTNWTTGARAVALLKSDGSKTWANDTNYEAEFYQEANGNLVVKQNGVIALQVINTQLTGTRIGVASINAGYIWMDDIEGDQVLAGAVIQRRRMEY
jgi:hypothetical protein